jgi:hypothetical protein
MTPVAVRIFHFEPNDGGPLTRMLVAARRVLADRHATAFRRAGAADVRIVAGAADDTSFGARLRAELPERGGMVILGSGAIPLARDSDVRRFVAVAAGAGRTGLANNRFSADVVAISDASPLRDLPDLPSDNALPRWLEEVAGFEVSDLASTFRLQVDYDSPLDLILATGSAERPLSAARSRLAEVAAVAANPRSELLITGRTSTATLRWAERRIPARTRVLIEERGLRASTDVALASRGPQRPPRSLLGHLLDADGPGALGAVVADVSDAAIIDTRVLLAHRLGPDERAWPPPEDRFASDLLLPDQVGDRWLRTLTDAAQDAAVPIALGGHTLVGPGLRLALRSATLRGGR